MIDVLACELLPFLVGCNLVLFVLDLAMLDPWAAVDLLLVALSLEGKSFYEVLQSLET